MKKVPYSRRVAQESGSNFYASFFFLPAEKRNGLFTIYAFSRLADDAVDEAPDEETGRREIQLWRERVGRIFDGSGPVADDGPLFHPILPELQETIRRFRMPSQYFFDLLTGIEMDLTQKRYETFAELERYCYHVAGTVGLLCQSLFGPPSPEGERYAVLLGCAFQLTNIIRDIGNDARRGRIYLPREELARFGVRESDILEGRDSPSFYELMRFQAERARGYFQKAEGVLPGERRILPAEIMSAFYRRLLQKIEKENFPVFERKVRLSSAEKLGLLAKSVVGSYL